MFTVLAAEDSPTQVSQAITFVIVGGVFAFITLWYNTRSKRKDVALAYAAESEKERRQEIRLDKVEKQAAEAARLLVASTAATAEHAALQMAKLDVLERHQTKIEKSQDIVHAMLNSAQTTQMLAYIVTLKSTRASLRTQHAQLTELFGLRSAPDTPLSTEEKNELTDLQEQIMALGLEIATNQDAVDDRVRAQELQESQERNKTKIADAAEAIADAAKQPIVIDRASITVGEVEAVDEMPPSAGVAAAPPAPQTPL